MKEKERTLEALISKKIKAAQVEATRLAEKKTADHIAKIQEMLNKNQELKAVYENVKKQINLLKGSASSKKKNKQIRVGETSMNLDKLLDSIGKQLGRDFQSFVNRLCRNQKEGELDLRKMSVSLKGLSYGRTGLDKCYVTPLITDIESLEGQVKSVYPKETSDILCQNIQEVIESVNRFNRLGGDMHTVKGQLKTLKDKLEQNPNLGVLKGEVKKALKGLILTLDHPANNLLVPKLLEKIKAAQAKLDGSKSEPEPKLELEPELEAEPTKKKEPFKGVNGDTQLKTAGRSRKGLESSAKNSDQFQI